MTWHQEGQVFKRGQPEGLEDLGKGMRTYTNMYIQGQKRKDRQKCSLDVKKNNRAAGKLEGEVTSESGAALPISQEL